MIKGILFDKDGTLIEFQSVWHEIIRRILTDLKSRYHFPEELILKLKEASGYQEHGFTRESIIQYAATSQITRLWYDLITDEGEEYGSGLTYQDLWKMFDEMPLQEDIEINAMKGARELLAYLQKKNYILGIATADTCHSAVFSLKKAGLLQYFQYIGCNEDSIRPKPENDMAVRFCRKYRLKPEELLIIGDSIVDMQFAENAGASFVGIRTTYNDYGKFSEHHWQSVQSIGDVALRYGL